MKERGGEGEGERRKSSLTSFPSPLLLLFPCTPAVCKQLNEKKHWNDPNYAAKELAQFAAFVKGSSDNCSAVVVLLKNEPPPQPARRRLFARAN